MILRDPVHGLVSFEAEEVQLVQALLQAREVQRLRRIRQLGLASLAYPGADHTRFSHALGAAHVMTRLVARLRQLDGELPYWQRLTSERARDAVVAALLHDVGHGPFSHLFEAAVPNAHHHESWSKRILLDPQTEVHQILAAADPAMPTRLTQLIAGEHALPYLAHAVSGTFDVDRCDYLLRDAYFTGVSYGRFDLDWLLRSLRFGRPSPSGAAPTLAVDGLKGVPAIESFVLARLFMFQQVYFHKASRASEWALGRILSRAGYLLRSGTKLPGTATGIAELLIHGETTLAHYLALDDTSLLHALDTWCDAADPTLRDLCSRLQRRRLFKTHELHGPDASPSQAQALLEVARELARERGYDPEYYVGLDTAQLVPFDDRQDSLRVEFPDGRSYRPEEVSFVLGRLNRQPLTRTRLLMPPELREEWLERATLRLCGPVNQESRS